MAAKLTKSVVENMAAGLKDVILWDQEVKGFGLKVTPKGKRVYFAYYRAANGQQRRPVIGVHGVVTAEEARQVAKKWIGGAFAGQDVSQDRQEARSAPLVKELAERYLEDHAKPFKKPSSYKSDKSNLEHHVLPLIGNKKVAEIARSDIEFVKSSIREGRTADRKSAKRRGRSIIKGGAGAANRVIALLSKMMACSVDWGMRPDNPALRIRKYPEHRKDRFLDLDEIKRLLGALCDAKTEGSETPHVIACFLLLLFSGLRRGEVLGLHWADVDFNRRILRLHDSKTGARSVPMNDRAMSVLAKLAENRKSEHVIASATGEGRPSLGKPWQRMLKRSGIDGSANIHCLRHTFASWAVMGGLSLPQTGALLGHKSAQTTLRYADHLTEAVREYSQRTAKLIAPNESRLDGVPSRDSTIPRSP
jgi:integrase